MKKGFTLVELLAVIVILAVILTLAVPKVMQLTNNKKQTLYEDTMNEIERLAASYVVDHPELLRNDNFTITLNTLCTNNYLECPIIDPRDNSEMNGNIVVYKNSKGTYEYAYGNNSTTTISNTTTANDNILSVNKVTITGKSEQINTTKSNNLAPPISKWTLSGGAYLEGDYIVLPSTTSSACTDTLWNKAADRFYIKATGVSTVAATTSFLIGFNYLNESKSIISSNGWAGTLKNTDTAFSNSFPRSTDTTGPAIGSSTYVRICFKRDTTYALNAYKVKNIYLSNIDSAYTPFIPDSPSPEYPSQINSVGTYNSTTNKYDVTLVNGKENLITNGYGELKNNTNFTSFTYTNDQVEDATNSFIKSTTGGYTLSSNELIPVDTNKKYKLSVDVKNNGTTARYYAGIVEYDIDKNSISSAQTNYVNNTLTYLTRELNNGDQVVYLNNINNFMLSTYPYQLGLIFWNYKDSTGYQYPELTYSRNVWTNLYTSANIDKINNTIKLETAWDKGPFPVGTKVSQSNAGNSYNYSLISNSTLTSAWQTKTSTIQGICDTLCNNKFREGTKYIKFLTLSNNGGTTGINTVTYYKNINISEYDQTKYTFSLNEPLRSLPDGTADKLIIDNVNKRAYVERNVGTITLTGASRIYFSTNYSNADYDVFTYSFGYNFGYNNGNLISYNSHFKQKASVWSSHGLGTYTLQDATSNGTAIIWMSLAKGKFADTAAFKTWLSSNPVTVQYKLNTSPPEVEELPYQEIQAINGKFDLTIGGSVQPNILVEGINKG